MVRVTTCDHLPAEEAKPAAVKGLAGRINMKRTRVVTNFYLRDPASNCCFRREIPSLDINTLLWRTVCPSP